LARKLRIWNGRGDYAQFDGRFFVCATTKKRAVELLKQAGHRWINMKEFTTYYSEAWGVRMEGVTPEEGVWFLSNDEDHYGKEVPKRLL
jgi:hypothetical protein